MIFIHYPKCSTCQKAKQWLIDHNLAFTERDIKGDNPTKEELIAWHKLSGYELKKFFNTSGLIYKDLGLKDKLPTMSEDEKFELLSTNGMLVKRPVIVDDTTVLVGFKAKEWEDRLLSV